MIDWKTDDIVAEQQLTAGRVLCQRDLNATAWWNPHWMDQNFFNKPTPEVSYIKPWNLYKMKVKGASWQDHLAFSFVHLQVFVLMVAGLASSIFSLFHLRRKSKHEHFGCYKHVVLLVSIVLWHNMEIHTFCLALNQQVTQLFLIVL